MAITAVVCNIKAATATAKRIAASLTVSPGLGMFILAAISEVGRPFGLISTACVWRISVSAATACTSTK
jgi:hypothetical protein